MTNTKTKRFILASILMVISAMTVIHTLKLYDTYYIPRIQYSYDVNATSFEGSNIDVNESNFGHSYKYKSSAERKLKNFPLGAIVEVYYKPDKPVFSSLTKKSAGFSKVLASLLFLAFAIFALLIALKIINPKNLPWRN